jgi:uncharacterized membrane protein YgaE (UPF0421/DUF939 family)
VPARRYPRLEIAAQRSRSSLRTRVDRLVAAGRSVAQIGLAATLAWLIATEVLGNPRPFFAPVAAIITVGVTYGQRGRRAIELGLGVAVGILVADLLTLLIGTGTLQLGIIVVLAVTAAILLGSGPLIVNQAGISAVLVVTIQPPGNAFAFERFFDALVGTATALVVGALFLPADPVALLRRAATPVLEELAATLEDIAQALLERDAEGAERALERARAIDALESRFYDAVDVSRETARFSPPRRSARDRVDLYAEAAGQVDLAVRNVRVMARGAIRALQLGDSVPPEVATALQAMAEAVRALGGVLEGDGLEAAVQEPALRAAGIATQVLDGTSNLSVSVIVGQIRSTAVDLLRSTGEDPDVARDAVRGAARAEEPPAVEGAT